ncbi:hypothetical protein PoB_000203800 [Plakobranchus ocellatus]|uniref:Uncharacterized protein n=1 Tax=Plakobranchus ocellatus TaxID=259542 RepID=A0AAV3XZX3_9GAST|nr:hypothetical protein PoB_000203800 [Plakobranchus ocellatus]
MAAVPNSFNGRAASGDNGGGAVGGTANRRKSGRGSGSSSTGNRRGNVFGTTYSSSNSSSVTSSSGSFGASMNAGNLLEMDENDNSFPWGLIHHNELAQMITAGLGKPNRVTLVSLPGQRYRTKNEAESE